MICLASYPITAEAVQPHIGKTVIGMTYGGDLFCAKIDRIQDGQVYFTCEGPPAAQVSSAIRNNPSIRNIKRKLERKSAYAQTKAFIPFFGIGTGLSFVIPLILLAALFAYPWY